jgi:hypothetical protein
MFGGEAGSACVCARVSARVRVYEGGGERERGSEREREREREGKGERKGGREEEPDRHRETCSCSQSL